MIFGLPVSSATEKVLDRETPEFVDSRFVDSIDHLHDQFLLFHAALQSI